MSELTEMSGTNYSGDDAASIGSAVDAFTSRVEGSLFVVTTGNQLEVSGCLAGFATQCSIVPPRFIVCISKVNHTYFVAERSNCVVLHLLREDQVELASLFGEESGDTVAKFEHCRWHRGLTGAPVLDDCAAWVEGSIMSRFSVGDHEAALMRPLGGGAGSGGRVLTYERSPSFRPGHPTPS
ncbi:MAG: flavin reductase family protein [Acidimicrobiales bacterium]